MSTKKTRKVVRVVMRAPGDRALVERTTKTQVLVLAYADQVRFAQALITPSRPTPVLRRAFARRRALLTDT